MQFEHFGKYLLLEKLASGGMAEVYLAKTIGINNFVAIKRILPQFSQNTEFIQMFREEAKIAANLRHSNIVSIHFFGREKGQLFLVMDFVEGQNLRQILNTLKKENKYLSMDQIVYLIKEVAAGLDYAHRALDNSTGKPLNIIHRDMSPQNIMISFEGEVKIVDFGIAKAETQIEQTQAGTIKGKFAYMSPEQAEGQNLDSRTDVFSLGVILWELLSKERLFIGPNEAATLKKVRDCQIPSLRKIDPNIPIELERITMKALNKNLDMRYTSANAFHKDLNRLLNMQYPEFSKTDFSKFMKGLFHDMFVENRKKLADYSQIPVDKEENIFDGNTKTATATETLTTTNANDFTSEGRLPGLDLGQVEKSEIIDLKNLKISDVNIPKTPLNFPLSPSGTGSGRTKSQYFAQIKIAPKQRPSSAMLILGLSIILGVSWYVWDKQVKDLSLSRDLTETEAKNTLAKVPSSSQNTEQDSSPEASPTEQPQISRTDQSSTESPKSPSGIVHINIQSNPSGAIVEINGRQSGITPYLGSLIAGKSVKILIRKEGFIPYEKEEFLNPQTPLRIEAVLQPEPPKGYLVIEMIGAPLDTVVEVNGRRIEDKSQLNLYAVPAKVPILIKAFSPFSGTSTSATVSVDINQKRVVKLVLSRQAQ
jgi:serine/threonine-protein kinase